MTLMLYDRLNQPANSIRNLSTFLHYFSSNPKGNLHILNETSWLATRQTLIFSYLQFYSFTNFWRTLNKIFQSTWLWISQAQFFFSYFVFCSRQYCCLTGYERSLVCGSTWPSDCIFFSFLIDPRPLSCIGRQILPCLLLLFFCKNETCNPHRWSDAGWSFFQA